MKLNTFYDARPIVQWIELLTHQIEVLKDYIEIHEISKQRPSIIISGVEMYNEVDEIDVQLATLLLDHKLKRLMDKYKELEDLNVVSNAETLSSDRPKLPGGGGAVRKKP